MKKRASGGGGSDDGEHAELQRSIWKLEIQEGRSDVGLEQLSGILWRTLEDERIRRREAEEKCKKIAPKEVLAGTTTNGLTL
jgi:hypothetical protein